MSVTEGEEELVVEEAAVAPIAGEEEEDLASHTAITPFAVVRSVIIEQLEGHARRGVRHRITRQAMRLLQRGAEEHTSELFRIAGRMRRLQRQSTLHLPTFEFARELMDQKNVLF